MFRKLFLDHPREVGESYLEHQRRALGFSGRLLAAGLACAVHALAPGLFPRTASRAVVSLNDRLVAGRRGSVSSSGAGAPA